MLGKDVLTVGIENWMSTWVGAIVDYSESLKTKAVVQAKLHFKESYKGAFINLFIIITIIIININVHYR